MTANRLSQEEHMEARRQAQNIQKTVNSAIGRRLVRCVRHADAGWAAYDCRPKNPTSAVSPELL
jgi:hypothetical protein